MNQVALHSTTSAAARVTLVDGEPMADSLDIAAQFEKRHDHVLRSIDGLLALGQDLGPARFVAATYEVQVLPNSGEQGRGSTRTHRCYRMNEQAFALVVMGFTGAKALRWKVAYSGAFKAMAEEIRRRQAPAFDPNDPASLRAVLLGYTEKLLAAEARAEASEQALVVSEAVIEEQRPKVEAFQAFLDDEGMCNLRTAARAIDAPCMLFIKWMEDRGYVIRENGDLQPSAAMRRDGYLKLRLKPDAVGKLRGQAMVTRGGLEWLRQRWSVGPGKVLALQAALADRQGRLAI